MSSHNNNNNNNKNNNNDNNNSYNANVNDQSWRMTEQQLHDSDSESEFNITLMGTSPTSATLFDSSPIAAAAAAAARRTKSTTTTAVTATDYQQQQQQQQQSCLSLESFLAEIPHAIRQRKAMGTHPSSNDDPVWRLMGRLSGLDRREWLTFAHFDPSRHYTRNLIATDHETFTVLLLCWNPGQESPIHDHPCDGCWMRSLQGTVREVRYQQQQQESNTNATPSATTLPLICTRDTILEEGGMVFIEDSEGYHKVGNPSLETPAITLHLYSPPYQRCKIWLDETRSDQSSTSSVCYYSEYGTIRNSTTKQQQQQ